MEEDLSFEDLIELVRQGKLTMLELQEILRDELTQQYPKNEENKVCFQS
jgi:hypothetical protein